MMRTHVDLFSGLGGFALAASWNGVQTVQFCEIDKRCRKFLGRAWKGVPIHDDVRALEWNGEPVWLLTAGVPCQPASRAGKQRGAEDDRWLWPEAIRILSLIRPAWALFENPAGIGDVGLAGILAAVENEGYSLRVFSIPACAVGAPHRRERYWIVANREQAGREGHTRADTAYEAGREKQDGSEPAYTSGNMADAETAAGVGMQDGKEHKSLAPHGRCDAGQWGDCVWLSCADGKVRRAPDDTFGLVDGLHRSVLGALGNSIVPQVAARIIAAMIEAEAAQ